MTVATGAAGGAALDHVHVALPQPSVRQLEIAQVVAREGVDPASYSTRSGRNSRSSGGNSSRSAPCTRHRRCRQHVDVERSRLAEGEVFAAVHENARRARRPQRSRCRRPGGRGRRRAGRRAVAQRVGRRDCQVECEAAAELARCVVRRRRGCTQCRTRGRGPPRARCTAPSTVRSMSSDRRADFGADAPRLVVASLPVMKRR